MSGECNYCGEMGCVEENHAMYAISLSSNKKNILCLSPKESLKHNLRFYKRIARIATKKGCPCSVIVEKVFPDEVATDGGDY